MLRRVGAPQRLLIGAAFTAVAMVVMGFVTLSNDMMVGYSATIAIAGAVFLLPALRAAMSVSGLRMSPLRYPELYLDPFWVRRLSNERWVTVVVAIAILVPLVLESPLLEILRAL